MGTELEPILIRIGDVVQVGEQIRLVLSYTTSVYGPPTIELGIPQSSDVDKRAKVLYHNDVIDLHGAGFRLIKDDNGPDFHFQSTLWETIEPTKRVAVDRQIPIILGYHGDVVGTARVSETGEIINVELSSDAGNIISKGLEWDLTKSLSITPNKEN